MLLVPPLLLSYNLASSYRDYIKSFEPSDDCEECVAAYDKVVLTYNKLGSYEPLLKEELDEYLTLQEGV